MKAEAATPSPCPSRAPTVPTLASQPAGASPMMDYKASLLDRSEDSLTDARGTRGKPGARQGRKRNSFAGKPSPVWCVPGSAAPSGAAERDGDGSIPPPKPESRAEYKKWRNECLRAYRDAQQQLVRQLDHALPASYRSACTKNIGSTRGLGIGGRSLLLVLEDARTRIVDLRGGLRVTPAVKTEKQAPAATPAVDVSEDPSPCSPVPRPLALDSSIHCEALLLCRSTFVVELQDIWTLTIARAGQGAADFFRDAPVASLVGQSLAHLMRCEDLATLRQSIAMSLSAEPSDSRIHLADFSATIEGGVSRIHHVFSCDPLEWEFGRLPSFGRLSSLGSLSLTLPSQYRPVVVQQIIPLEKQERGQVAVAGRVLLMASFGNPTTLPQCTTCGRACGFQSGGVPAGSLEGPLDCCQPSVQTDAAPLVAA
jgi:hypothetical protein